MKKAMKDYLEYSGIIDGIGSPREIYIEIKEIYISLFEKSNKKFVDIL